MASYFEDLLQAAHQLEDAGFDLPPDVKKLRATCLCGWQVVTINQEVDSLGNIIVSLDEPRRMPKRRWNIYCPLHGLDNPQETW